MQEKQTRRRAGHLYNIWVKIDYKLIFTLFLLFSHDIIILLKLKEE